jgi:eukaryotic-like serine/threonine-protein kinase
LDSGFEFQGTSRFQLVRRLGGGGMGVVYEALDRDRSARVALKTLRTLDATALLRFKNEFRWLQDLQHPNLVSLGELFAEDGQWFFTMELVDGVDFLAWVRPQNERTLDEIGALLPAPLDLRRLRDALPQLVRGILALHNAQKVHRDIKPSNILVTPEGRVVLLDFGLAGQLRPTGPQSDSQVVGTVDYMAPEQAASKPVGPEADWYSLGTVLYEALTGRLPFNGPPLEVLLVKQNQSPPAPRVYHSDVPPDLDALCMDLLRKDPGGRPSGAEVLKRLGVPEVEPQRAPPQSQPGSPFVGRRRELTQLDEAYAEMRKGQPVTLLVQGESGVGKSVMVRRFVEKIGREQTGTVVLTGQCYERETVPYKAFDGIIDSLSRYMMKLPKAEAAAILPLRTGLLAQVFPVLRRVEAVAQSPLPRNEVPSPQELRTRVFAALRELLCRLAERHPLVLVVDDLQWADTDSLQLLAEVLRPPDAPALLFVATVRVASESSSSGTHGSTRIAAALAGDVRHIAVKRLPPDEALALVGLLFGEGRVGEAGQRAIAEEADGHPLFIDELVRHALTDTSGESHAALRLEDALWARVNRQPASVRQLLELITVAGAPMIQETAAAAANLDFGEFGKRSAELRAAHLVRTSGARRTDTIEAYHDRVREAVLQHLDSRTRKKWHERLALALEAASRADPEALMVHWRGAGDSERAAHYAALAAAEAAHALAFARSARLYRQAIELRPIEGAMFQAQLGHVLAAAGHAGEAALAFLEAAKGAAPSEAIELQRHAAEQLLFSGHIDEGIKALKRVLDTMKLALPPDPKRALRSLLWNRTRIRLRGLRWTRRDASQVKPADLSRTDLCWSVGVGLGLVDNVRGADYQARHLLYALQTGEPKRIARGLSTEVVYATSTQNPKRAATLLAQLDALVATIDDPHTQALAQMAHGISAFLDGRWRTAIERLGAADGILRERCTGVIWELDTVEILSLSTLFWLGRLREMCDRQPILLRMARERGDLFAKTNLRTAMSLVAFCRDEPQRARLESMQAIEKWSQAGFHTQHYYDLITQVHASIYGGDGESALRILEERWPKLEASMQMRVQMVRGNCLEIRARCLLASAAANPPERAERLAEVDRVVALIGKERKRWLDPSALTFRAAATALRGDEQRAAALLEQAATGYDAADMRLHSVVARRQRGRIIGGDEGKALINKGNEWLISEGVKSPVRFCAMLAPGFPDW